MNSMTVFYDATITTADYPYGLLISAEKHYSGYSGEVLYTVSAFDYNTVEDVEEIETTPEIMRSVFEQMVNKYSAG